MTKQKTDIKTMVAMAKAERRVYSREEVKVSIDRRTLKRTYTL